MFVQSTLHSGVLRSNFHFVTVQPLKNSTCDLDLSLFTDFVWSEDADEVFTKCANAIQNKTKQKRPKFIPDIIICM